MALDSTLLFAPAHQQAALIRTKQISSLELTEAYLTRIASLNPRVNAFITSRPIGRTADARAADAAIARGEVAGPLHGVPYTPKDILATKGILTTNGSKVTAKAVPDYESTITARLAHAGAVLVGKLNLLEFAMGSGVVSGFGPARNPWDLDYSPAGSSSGSGAALAAHMVPLSIGTDTGGSIRGPADVLRHRRPEADLRPCQPAWCDDARVDAGSCGADDAHRGGRRADAANHRWRRRQGSNLRRRSGARLRECAARRPQGPSHRCAAPLLHRRRARGGGCRFQAALKTIGSLGATTVEVDVPNARYATSAGWIVAMAEAAQFHEKRMRETPQLFDPIIRERLDAARFYSATDYIKALRVRTLLMDDMAKALAQCDVIAVPGNTRLPTKLEPPEIAGTDVKPGSKPPRFRPAIRSSAT